MEFIWKEQVISQKKLEIFTSGRVPGIAWRQSVGPWALSLGAPFESCKPTGKLSRHTLILLKGFVQEFYATLSQFGDI